MNIAPHLDYETRSMLHAVGVRKDYHTPAGSLTVLRDITLGITAEETLMIYGASGSGKSTLLHILGGLDRPTTGEVSFESQSLYQMTDDARATYRNRHIGFVFQFYYLVPELSALENVMLPGLLGGLNASTATTRATAMLERVGMEARQAHLPSTLSGGEQQRVAIARALVQRPRILLADEPTGNLDTARGADVMTLLRTLQREDGMAIVMVTHNRALIHSTDRVLALHEGMLHAA